MKIQSTAVLIWRPCAAYMRSPAGRTFFAGGLAGFYLLAFCHEILATFGTSLTSVTAFSAAIALGLDFGLRDSRREKIRSSTSWRATMFHFLLAAWVALSPWLIEFTTLIAAQIPSGVMAAPGRQLLFQVLAGVALLSFPVFLLARTPILLSQSFEGLSIKRDSGAGDTPSRASTTTPSFSRWSWRGLLARFSIRRRGNWPGSPVRDVVSRYLLGTAAGVVAGTLLVAPWLGIHIVALAAACASLGLAGITCVRWVRGATSLPEGSRTTTCPPNEPICESRAETCWRWFAAVCLGGLLAVVIRMVGQLAAAASFLVYIEWTAVLAGVAAGLSPRLRTGNTRGGICLAIAMWAVIVLISYSALTEFSLLVNAYVSQPWLMIALRAALVAAVLAPFGFAWGRLATTGGQPTEATSRTAENSTELPSLQTFAVVAGYLSARWVAFPRWATSDLLWAFVWAMGGLAAIRVVAERRFSLPRGRRRRAVLAAAIGSMIAVPFVRGQYDPVRTARQLFATNVFVARVQGLKSEQLSFLDEGRNVARREGERGTLTVWRYRGNQLQIRESGVPKAIVSTNPQICPHFTAEVMQALMPLTLHERPRRVMILGIGGGVPLTTSLAFPVMHVTCADSDRELVTLLQQTVWNESPHKPLADTRLRYLPIDPVMAVACRGGEYDVVISSPDQSALLQATPYFTRRFYRGVARQLASDGIFCQRFHQVDYGPMPLQTTVKTLQSVFRNVVAIEIASGEMALLATNSEKGLSRDGLVTRYRTPHVRRALGEIGWDWSVPMNLTAFGHEGLRKFADATPNTLNTAANGRLAFRLPQEVMRWGPKWRELLALIGPHGSRFAESKGIDSQDPEFLRRLSEVTGQRKLMTAFPDQWWAYRKSLKKQIRTRPRTLIQKVSAESKSGRFHPEDRRRMRYLAALDQARKTPTSESIYHVSMFEEPYDPLLSYFVHQETAELYGRSADKDDAEELRHRLHAVYFSHARDRSVRTVAAAIDLVANSKGATKSSTERWDQLNALMQVLKGRWAYRGLVKPKSVQIVLNDIDDCLSAVTAAVQTMDAIREDAQIPQADWDARRSVLKRGLIRPLKTYRKNLLTHHLKERHRLRKLLEIDEAPDPNDATDSKNSSGKATAPIAN